MLEEMAQRSIRAWSRALVARQLDARIEGIQHLPPSGAMLIACRHVHHLYDGCLLLAAIPRPAHLLVALDWVADRRTRLLMEWACGTARWPMVLRTERLQPSTGPSAYRCAEVPHYLRRAARASVDLLRAGQALVVFPEAFPNIDPHPTPKTGDDAFLPFRPGFAGLVAMAQRDGHSRIPIVPAGLTYRRGRRWQATLRFAAPLFIDSRADRLRVLHAVEAQVRLLSARAPRPTAETSQPLREDGVR